MLLHRKKTTKKHVKCPHPQPHKISRSTDKTNQPSAEKKPANDMERIK